jgi:hypothetical protein
LESFSKIILSTFIQKVETIMQTNEEEKIKSVIEKAYIEGIHTTQNEDAIRSGFTKILRCLFSKMAR